ncbi:phage head-tail adapter protein [Enterococcus dongliensis]|uniref:phage head-tail adapter protein n=1 Tax=Enterococcus dongliensis TaxID=2559925 RepID=UPI00288E6FD9|nr:phage head-tail adapter protein [Enterococcus dongliensis]MDT2648033.1 phage head-tail adapter protein [Enterococcus dongliensis]
MRKSRTGKLNTKINFWEYIPKKGPDPGEAEKKILYKARAELYDPSMKDLEILNGKGTKKAVTMVVRDPRGQYLPTNKHFVEIADYRMGEKWNIVDVRNDFTDNRFITILLAVYADE